MKTTILLRGLAILLCSAGLYSCEMQLGERGNGQIITEEYEVGNFDEIEFGGNFDVILRESETPGLIIMTDENLIDLIEVENRAGKLEITTRRKLRPSDDSQIIVEYTELRRIDVSGAASLRADNNIEGKELEVFMSGAGEIDLAVDLKSLRLDVSGAGAVELRGYAGFMEIGMSGAGGFDGDELETEECVVSISGVGGASVYVTKRLDASVSGVGGVAYRGNPSVVNKNVSGLGSIEASDDKAM